MSRGVVSWVWGGIVASFFVWALLGPEVWPVKEVEFVAAFLYLPLVLVVALVANAMMCPFKKVLALVLCERLLEVGVWVSLVATGFFLLARGYGVDRFSTVSYVLYGIWLVALLAVAVLVGLMATQRRRPAKRMIRSNK